MLLRIVLVSAVMLAAGTAQAQRLPALFAEAGGSTGLYAVGLEQTVLHSSDDARRLAVRAGVGAWVDHSPFIDGSDDTVVRAPIGATASFALGAPLGVPARFETTAGVMIDYNVNELRERISGNAVRIGAPLFGEIALRAEPGRWATVRLGVAAGGRIDAFHGSSLSPVLGVGVRL